MKGSILSIRGVVVDVQFAENETPKVYDALHVKTADATLTLEVETVLSPGAVRMD
jgi:F-type H+-transporting ATPase subunit beta